MGETGTFVPTEGVMDIEQAAEELGGTIRERRRAYGLTQAQLATLTGVAERSIRSIEKGKATARLDSVLPLLDALGIRIISEGPR